MGMFGGKKKEAAKDDEKKPEAKKEEKGELSTAATTPAKGASSAATPKDGDAKDPEKELEKELAGLSPKEKKKLLKEKRKAMGSDWDDDW